MKRIFFLLFFFAGLGYGLFFELKRIYLILICLLYAGCYIQFQKQHLQQTTEIDRFRQINAYMSQISQSFVRTKNVLSALQETASTFPPGNMQTLLSESIDILLLEGGDITEAEKKALHRLEQEYPCEKLHTLHEFMLLAESRGGECKREFILLEKMRLAWEHAIWKYHQELMGNRNLTVFLYCLMLGVCAFVLHAFPEELSIVHLEFIQITNFLLVSLLAVFFVLLDKQLCGQFFRQPRPMTHKKEIEAAFPKWLFDLMLLMQRESVESAIIHSISTAPPILQPELHQMSQLILSHPGEISIFTSFLAEYQLPQVEFNMRKLYALSIGAEQKEESVSFMIESNMDDLMKAEEKIYEIKGGVSTLFQFLPLLLSSIGMLIYCFAIVIVSLACIGTLFE